MFDAVDPADPIIEGDCPAFGMASFVCRIAEPGRGWRRRCGEVHVVVVETRDGAFTQVVRLPVRGRDVFVERIFPGREPDAARAYARARFGAPPDQAASISSLAAMSSDFVRRTPPDC